MSRFLPPLSTSRFQPALTMLPKKYAPVLFGLVLSCLMSCIVSGVSTLKAVGPIEGFLFLWLKAWLASWAVAFPVVLVVAPLARRAVERLVR
jgi:hypothetical protein